MTIVDCFKKVASTPKVMREVETGKELAFQQVWDNALARRSDFYGQDQKIVMVILPNSIVYIEYLLAVIATNNIFNPSPYFVSLQEFGKILEYVDPFCVVTDRADIVEKYKGRVKIIDPSAPLINIDQSQDKGIDENSPAALYYSSGTTGNPKGVLYSHKNMVSLIASINRGFRFTADDNQFAFLPFGHTASINYNILPALMAGSNLYISRGFEEMRAKFFEILARYGITYTEIVPTVLLMLLKLDIDIAGLDLRRLRFLGCGSSTLPLISQKEFIEKYNIKVCNLYGLSETGPSHIDYPLEDGWKPGGIGVPLDVNVCRISPEGEILLKGDNVFVGYYKNENLYREVVRDGWFHTGDIGVEREGKYYFVDRKKDLIIKGGINIVPMEVEEVFYKHAGVHECVVVGKEDKLVGEDIVAVVVPKNGAQGNEFTRELKALCKDQLSNYKVPSKILIWDKLPKTHSNKILRRKVREIINGTVELDFLVRAVCEAGLAAQKAFDGKKYSYLSDFRHERITEKSQHELVIEEDILCQNIIVRAIRDNDPDAVVYSEELDNLDALQRDASPKKYLIDPLDGTHNFCFGLPFWGISVAVLDAANTPVAAVIFIPEFDMLLKCDGPGHPTLIRTGGVWTETSTAQKKMREALICYDNQFYKLGSQAYALYENITKACFTTRITGSAVFDIALIAAGKVNARIWNKTNSYDIAGGIPIVKGAGGHVSDFDGRDVNIFSEEVIMSSDKSLSQKLLELIRQEQCVRGAS
jgi:acyl-CoA synthetase (AMP-forming)/AMP-acid ligase II/fructose-1,6-bisphosphatase/inositol monophosphatase family enzyme